MAEAVQVAVKNEHKDFVEKAISDHSVVVFGKSWCPFTLQAVNSLKEYGIPHVSFMMDKMANGNAIHSEVKSMTQHPTVPVVFVSHKYVGGCSELVSLLRQGKLDKLREESKEKKLGFKGERQITSNSLFLFPSVNNNVSIRFTGVISVVICIIGIIFRNYEFNRWMILGLAIDFLLRFLTGPFLSPIGMVSNVLASQFPPEWSAGPPKQFAALCGFSFSAIAAGCFLGDSEVAGSVFLALLAGATGLQGFFNFCFGCLIYGYLIKFGIASALVYKPYLNMLDDKKHTFDRMNTVFTEVPKKEVVYTPSGYAPLQTDLKHKGRVWNGDYKSDELHFIKHAHVAYFLAPTALATLALAWQASTQVLSTAREIWHFVAIVAAIVYFALLALYLAKLVLYPHRVLKEWSNPVSGNAMFLIPVTWMMLSYLEYVDDVDASRVLFWIGAVIQMAMTILKAADWFYFPSSAGNINSSWLILPAACFVGTIAGNFSNAPGYDEPLLFWFGVGIVLSIGIYAVIIYSVILDHYSDRRQRPFLAFHGALPALILLAYLSTGSAFDLFAKSLFYYTCFAHIIMLAGSIRGFFMIHRFDVSYWAFGVSFSAFALASLYYHQALGTKWSEVLVYITLSAACTSVFVLFVSTIKLVQDTQLFIPLQKWGPMSFMKLTHDAFREASDVILKKINALDMDSIDVVKSIKEEYENMKVALEIHARHEDRIIFPEIEKLFPGVTKHVADDHSHHDASLTAFEKSMNALLGDNPSSELLEELKKSGKHFIDELLEHLRREETSATVVVRKHFTSYQQKSIAEKSYDLTSADELHVYFAWVLNNLRFPGQRENFLRAFIWAMPFRAQEIGGIVFRGVSDVLWAELSEYIPEMIPKRLNGYKRLY